MTKVREVIFGTGHENTQATHPTTIMITKDAHLSETGDCIVAVDANKGLANLSSRFKKKLRKLSTKITILIEADNLTEQITAYGSPKLILTHPTDMVIRKSNYICNRTLAIQADKSAKDLSRIFVEKLKAPKSKIKITLIAES
jgi:uncharacterized protein